MIETDAATTAPMIGAAMTDDRMTVIVMADGTNPATAVTKGATTGETSAATTTETAATRGTGATAVEARDEMSPGMTAVAMTVATTGAEMSHPATSHLAMIALAATSGPRTTEAVMTVGPMTVPRVRLGPATRHQSVSKAGTAPLLDAPMARTRHLPQRLRLRVKRPVRPHAKPPARTTAGGVVTAHLRMGPETAIGLRRIARKATGPQSSPVIAKTANRRMNLVTVVELLLSRATVVSEAARIDETVKPPVTRGAMTAVKRATRATAVTMEGTGLLESVVGRNRAARNVTSGARSAHASSSSSLPATSTPVDLRRRGSRRDLVSSRPSRSRGSRRLARREHRPPVVRLSLLRRRAWRPAWA